MPEQDQVEEKTMSKKMKINTVYLVKTMYGDTEAVSWAGDAWLGQTSGRKYEENEFISCTKAKGIKKEKENKDE